MTQTSSKPRVKHDKFGEEGLTALFEAYQELIIGDFRNYCTEVIEGSAGKRATKDKFINLILKSPSKNDMLTKTTNYLMAGQGLGV